jgi:dTDP-4-dehydrorhamnose 3,5-epimerase
MKLRETPLKDAWLIDLERKGDSRGFFARLFCEQDFADAGLESDFVQINDSLSAKAGTLRGLHYQLPPFTEVKVVRCIRGSLWDCIVDLRPDSPTFKKWFGVTLSADNRTMLYVPRGFAHGFVSLQDDAEVMYLVSATYAPEYERGVRWDDPAFAIDWPCQPAEISDKDGSWPYLEPDYHRVEALRTAGLTVGSPRGGFTATGDWR